MNTTARKLTLEEIKALPKASVIWIETQYESDEGIVWYSLDPVMVCVPGENGCLIGGDRDSYIDLDIDDHLLDGSTMWSMEPAREQLTGITAEEYDALTDRGNIVFPGLATAITSNKFTFEDFCKHIGLKYKAFWNAITGKREFCQHEIITIRTALNLSDDETRAIFFPAALAQI